MVFLFEVKASNDAHVALTVEGDESKDMFEIVLGGWDNSQSVIRTQKQGTEHVTYAGSVLDKDNFSSFWITYNKDGTLKVGEGKKLNVSQIMT